jgi:hypothetical protein
MSAKGIPTRSQDRPAERADSVWSAKLATGEIAKPSRHQTPKPQPTNGDTVFDPEPRPFWRELGWARRFSI